MVLTLIGAAFADGPVAVPFEELASGHLVVACTIDGRGPYRFVVDTGANAFVVDPDVARDLGVDLARAPTKKVHAADGHIAIPMVMLRDVRMGARELDKALAIVTDVEPLLGDPGVMGILGRDMFVGERLEVDFPKDELRVVAPRRDPEALPLARLRGGLSGVRLENGLTVVLDLGSSLSILNPAGALLLAAPAAPPIPGVAAGLGGAIDFSSWVQLPSIDLGDRTPGGPVPVVELGVFETLGIADTPALLLGVDQMQGRVLTIDYGAKNVSLRAADR
jgi:hypothetical protein